MKSKRLLFLIILLGGLGFYFNADAAVVLGISSGFVTSTPSVDPGGVNITENNNAFGFRDTAPTGATTITEIWVWSDASEGSETLQIALYGNSGNAPSGARLYYDTLTISGSGWKGKSVNWPITAGTQYWMLSEAPSFTANQNTVGGRYIVYSSGGHATLDDPVYAGTLATDGYVGAIAAVWSAGSPPATSYSPRKNRVIAIFDD